MLKLMYITNDPQVAQIAESAGVDRIFVDMETVGKDVRQGGMNTVQSHHTVADAAKLRSTLTKADLLVRVNPIYANSEKEIDEVIGAGADLVMLPYFKTVNEVRQFVEYVDGRAKTVLLFETPDAVAHIDEILALPGIDECFIGLNDLHLGYQRKFMFELLADGIVETICRKFTAVGKPYGFGGIARVGTGTLPAECIIGEHVRLGSTAVILSRSFCNTASITDPDEIREIFDREVPKVRQAEQAFAALPQEKLIENHRTVQAAVKKIVENIK